MAFEWIAHARCHLLDWDDCGAVTRPEYLASRCAGCVLCVLPLVRERGAGFLGLPIRRNAVGGRIYLVVFCSPRPSAGTRERSSSVAREFISAAMGMVPDLLRVRHGEAGQRRYRVAKLHRYGRVLPERPAADLDWLVCAAPAA